MLTLVCSAWLESQHRLQQDALVRPPQAVLGKRLPVGEDGVYADELSLRAVEEVCQQFVVEELPQSTMPASTSIYRILLELGPPSVELSPPTGTVYLESEQTPSILGSLGVQGSPNTTLLAKSASGKLFQLSTTTSTSQTQLLTAVPEDAAAQAATLPSMSTSAVRPSSSATDNAMPVPPSITAIEVDTDLDMAAPVDDLCQASFTARARVPSRTSVHAMSITVDS